MKFGNWNITDTAIEWNGDGNNQFVIDRATLLDLFPLEGGGDSLYKWIVVATEDESLEEDDLYDLNYAFAFVAGQDSPDQFDYTVFDQTLEYQYYSFEDAEEEEEE